MYEHFPYANFHEINLDWLIQEVQKLQSGDNLVLSVNGQTGDVVLYKNYNTQLPEVGETLWNITRRVDGSSEGIQFVKNAPAQRINNTNRYDIYDAGNPPPYPVTSVNGQTGDVNITAPVQSVNGETGNVILYKAYYIRFPSVTENLWSMTRQVDGSSEGIQFLKNAPAQRINNTNRYDIYDAGNPPPYPVTSVNGQTGAVQIDIPVTSVNGQTGAVTINIPVTSVNGKTGEVLTPFENPDANILQLDTNTSADYWGLTREINSGAGEDVKGNASLYIEKANGGAVKAYIAFTSDDETVSETFQLLTTNEIPAGGAVLSINGMNGVVTLYADNIQRSSENNETVETALARIDDKNNAQDSDITNLQDGLAIVANGNTHAAIANGQFVYVKNHSELADGLYKATAAIDADETLSTDNLAADGDGGLNDLQTQVDSVNSNLSSLLVSNTYPLSGGVDSGQNERNPYYDFRENNSPMGHYLCLTYDNNKGVLRDAAIVFYTAGTEGTCELQFGNPEHFNIADGRITGRKLSWYARVNVYKIKYNAIFANVDNS